MAKAPAWTTACPECKKRIVLGVTVKQGPKIRGEQAVEARVTVDTTRLRTHMMEAHAERYRIEEKANGTPTHSNGGTVLGQGQEV
jgi:hypothetical protein